MLLEILVVVIVFCLLFWLVQQYAPAPPSPVRMILTILLVVILCIWLLNAVGIYDLGSLNTGHRH